MLLASHEAGVAELVDARDSKSRAGDSVRVRFPPPAPLVPLGHPRTCHPLRPFVIGRFSRFALFFGSS